MMIQTLDQLALGGGGRRFWVQGHPQLHLYAPLCMLCCELICVCESRFSYGGQRKTLDGVPCLLLVILSLFNVQCYILQANFTWSFWGFFCLHLLSCHWSTKITDVCCCVWLYISSGDLSPVPHACVAFYQLRRHAHPCFLCAFYASVELLINLGSLQ